MSKTRPSRLLRQALFADAAASGATGLLLLLGGDVLAGLAGMPPVLLQAAGLVLLPFAALVLWLAAQPLLPRWAVWATIVTNALWAVDSLLLLASGWIDPTALGVVFVVGQALAVAMLAELQYIGLKRTPAAA